MDPTQRQTPPSYSKESLIRRYKPIWRILLISNLALGGIFSVVAFVLMLYSFNFLVLSQFLNLVIALEVV
ncbi:hypothetical protein WN944_001140 [Citrus x changshan-huyou]|uniref:Uncharacterized protein n=1 Tax=Citrus x changshan-huyou TaxID=2935761 RepID=A0AAP0QR33_9ROSI